MGGVAKKIVKESGIIVSRVGKLGGENITTVGPPVTLPPLHAVTVTRHDPFPVSRLEGQLGRKPAGTRFAFFKTPHTRLGVLTQSAISLIVAAWASISRVWGVTASDSQS